jgi:acyl-CoA dehydrogenase
MNRRWSEESMSFAASVRAAADRLGAVEFVRRAEADPGLRRDQLAPVLDALGFDDVNIFGDGREAEVAAAAARAAGAVALPWPVASRFAVPHGYRDRIGAVYLGLRDEPRRLEHLDLSVNAVALDMRTGAASALVAESGVRHMPLDPFGVDCTTAGTVPPSVPAQDIRQMIDAHVILSAFYVLGALDTVARMTAVYASERVQFDQPIAQFGGIQWRLADIVVASCGLAELASFTLFRFSDRTITPADAAALRYLMLDASGVVLANAHQVFGAIGLCEEHDLTVIDRHLQPIIRRPAGLAATSLLLRDEIAAHGFDGVFPVRPIGVALAGSAK